MHNQNLYLFFLKVSVQGPSPFKQTIECCPCISTVILSSSLKCSPLGHLKAIEEFCGLWLWSCPHGPSAPVVTLQTTS